MTMLSSLSVAASALPLLPGQGTSQDPGLGLILYLVLNCGNQQGLQVGLVQDLPSVL